MVCMSTDVLRCLEERLRERGCRVTGTRRQIAEHAFVHFGHFSAEALLGSLARHGRRVSRASVYRTLERLVELGLLRRYDLPGSPALYEPALGRTHHEHLVCESCGTILEFVQEEIERLQDEICRALRFEPHSHTLQIRGLCEGCQGNAAATRRAPSPGLARAAAGGSRGSR